MIQSFADGDTEALFRGGRVRRVPADLVKRARRTLARLDGVSSLLELRSPPGNRLEALQGDRKGQHSIRVNDQFRICFTWTEAGPAHVAFVDYH